MPNVLQRINSPEFDPAHLTLQKACLNSLQYSPLIYMHCLTVLSSVPQPRPLQPSECIGTVEWTADAFSSCAQYTRHFGVLNIVSLSSCINQTSL